VTARLVDVQSIATGGDGIARDGDGKVVFVEGAAPGDRVEVEITEERTDYARAKIVSVRAPSADRIEPPCAHVSDGCGGCSWQHLHLTAQLSLKQAIVVDALTRIGRLREPLVHAGPALDPFRFRTTLRMAVDGGGRLAYRRRHSNDLVTVDDCLIAHPLLQELIEDGRFEGASEVTLRCASSTSERLVLVNGATDRIKVPSDVVIVGRSASGSHERAGAERVAAERNGAKRVGAERNGAKRVATERAGTEPDMPRLHEIVQGVRFAISPTSFFQARPDGAAALVDVAREHLRGAPEGPLLDAYCGVGLFAATLGAGRAITGLELHGAAARDARDNIGPHARIVRTEVARWRPSPAAVVIADPARPGLGRRATSVLAATGAAVLVLVSCDPASLGRDAMLLGRSGYEHDRSVVVDLFPHTAHIEVVSRFSKR